MASDLGLTEAPHLFWHDGYYYLTTAEGGTGYDHAVTLARSRDIRGPYETHPAKHVITARFNPENPIQRMGHGQYVEGHDGRFWHSFLCGRPQKGPRGLFCATGRETGLAEVVWRDGWLWLKDGGMLAPTTVDLAADAGGSVRRWSMISRAHLADGLPVAAVAPSRNGLFTDDGERVAADRAREPGVVV
ncbi:MAG: family 43 glycosylhydrolase [Saprospiraceae bacterium]|nr:family 43 glycosylhydrolase [Saprospiraceae bacterium]